MPKQRRIADKNAPAAEQINFGQVFVLSNYILKYARDERVKYISHLDFIRTFNRTVRRAGLELRRTANI